MKSFFRSEFPTMRPSSAGFGAIFNNSLNICEYHYKKYKNLDFLVQVDEISDLFNTPEIKFDSLIEKIVMSDDDIKYLFENSFTDTLNHIFSRNIYNLSESEYPIFAFVQKANIFYIYENEEAGWVELNREFLIKFLNKVHMKLLRVFIQHKKDNVDKIRDDEGFSILCDKTTLKLMNADFSQESILGKIRANMYSRMKTDMKALVECEFEF
jgi:hypothetical protein